jgi:hypothetical protein
LGRSQVSTAAKVCCGKQYVNKSGNYSLNGELKQEVGRQENIMKLLFAAAFAAGTLPLALTGAPALAQQTSTVPELTCRAALEGSEFFEINREDAPPCCYVTEELAWYQENDVLLNRFYEKEGPAVYYTIDQCSVALDGTGIVAGDPGIDDTPTGSIPDGGLTDPLAANPGNPKPVGNAGETPNGGDGWAEPDAGPGVSGQGD